MASVTEHQPLLSQYSRPRPGTPPPTFPSNARSEKTLFRSVFYSPPVPTGQKRTCYFPLSFRTNILIAMVAIPAYLLASSAFSSLGPLWPRDSVIRSPAPAAETGASSKAASASSAFGTVRGPLISTNFPDPAIIYVDGVSYAFATNNRGIGSAMIRVQMATSIDNTTWTLSKKDALPTVAAWETGGHVWAPDVVQLDDGTFVLYYSDDLVDHPAHHCVGAATSKNVMGPYTPLDQPLACPDVETKGGAIDPDGFVDPSTNRRYVVYKVDGNSIGHGGSCGNTVEPIVSTPLMLQEVGSDGITLIGKAREILDRDARDGPLIEAPTLHRSEEGIYFLFYSSNCFTTPKYDVAYATADNIWGPYTRASRPLLVTNDASLTGPGGMDIVKGGNLIIFHGHMTFQNDPTRKKQAETIAAQRNVPVADVILPLVRGMWTGTATFNGREISLA